MKKRKISTLLATCLLSASMAQARDFIAIVGSSTVYPFATTVAERFGKTTPYKTPKIESTGSGGGMKLFCGGVGLNHPDISNASRRIKESEFAKCQSNGVNEIVEVKIGYDGIVMANSKKAPMLHLSRRDIYLALAKEVPDPRGGKVLVENPYHSWHEVNPALPDIPIRVLGPPPTSGTRDAFDELAVEGGCQTFPWLDALKKQDKKHYKAVCRSLREDGAYVEAGENDNLIVQKLAVDPQAVGVFGYSFLDQNGDKIQGSPIEGVEPTFENISDGAYPVSRPLFFYVKKAHVKAVPGMREYLAEFTSERAWGEEGYLADKGMIPMPDEERTRFARQAADLLPLRREQLRP